MIKVFSFFLIGMTKKKEKNNKTSKCDVGTNTEYDEHILMSSHVEDPTTYSITEWLYRKFPQLQDTCKSLYKNRSSWFVFLVTIYLISSKNFLRGIITFIVMHILVYVVHYESHFTRNWMTISHHYHHENNNWFSHNIQILLEMHFILIFPILNKYLFDNVLDKWVLIFLYLVYTAIHNINYSIFHVNQTHELHHKDIFTNMGPDICDILFETKNQENKKEDGYLEDASHFIPNIWISAFIVLILKCLYKFPICKWLMHSFSLFALIIVTLIVSVSNTYLSLYYNKPATKNDNKDGNKPNTPIKT